MARRAIKDPASRIRALLAAEEPGFRTAFLEAVSLIRSRRTLDRLAALLQQGRVEDALDSLAEAAAHFGGQYGAALSAAAERTASFLSDGTEVRIRFDVSNEGAVRAIRSSRLRLIRGFEAEQRRTVRDALVDSVARGENPRVAARAFRDSIGLTPNQVAMVNNYRRLLMAGRGGTPSAEALERALRDGRFDRSVLRAMRENEPLKLHQVERMVDRYRQRMLAFRAENIARTEALRSVHEGSFEMYEQATQQGVIDPRSLRRSWVTAGDERVRDSHWELSQQEPHMVDEPWVTISGAMLRFPGDPLAPADETINCRCTLATRAEGPLI